MILSPGFLLGAHLEKKTTGMTDTKWGDILLLLFFFFLLVAGLSLPGIHGPKMWE